jgi:long-chain fatty acid transport protein
MNNPKRLLALAVSAALAAPITAHATNGMNLEAYGPIAAGMGGASMAYDNGTAAMMNNPATLGLMDEGNRLDVAVGFMLPTVTTEMGTMSFDSTATSFMMPALGWAKKSGKNTYGVGMFSQGGMGATYDGGPGGAMSGGWMTMSSPYYNVADMSTYSPCDVVAAMAGTTCGTPASDAAMTAAGMDTAAGTAMALQDKSEVGVGRIIFPFAREMNDKVTLAGSIDYVWAGMDLRMAMPGMMMGDMMMNPASTTGTISGGLPLAIGTMMGDNTGAGNGIMGLNYGYFDFSDSSSFTGEAKGAGFAGKLGMTFKASEKLTIGATYHTKTAMSDLKTKNAKVDMSVLMDVDPGTGTFTMMEMPITMTGDMTVKDFEWPSTIALGVAFQASDKLMVALDAKRINWADAMKNFTMRFDATSISMGGGDVTGMFTDKDMTAVMYQNWKDQTVIQLGAAYAVTDAATVRVGYNSSSNPVPDATMNWLFPAITEKAYTAGLGYVMNDKSSVDVSVNYVPETTGGGVNGFTTKMSQTNYQLMYSHKF